MLEIWTLQTYLTPSTFQEFHPTDVLSLENDVRSDECDSSIFDQNDIKEEQEVLKESIFVDTVSIW